MNCSSMIDEGRCKFWHAEEEMKLIRKYKELRGKIESGVVCAVQNQEYRILGFETFKVFAYEQGTHADDCFYRVESVLVMNNGHLQVKLADSLGKFGDAKVELALLDKAGQQIYPSHLNTD